MGCAARSARSELQTPSQAAALAAAHQALAIDPLVRFDAVDDQQLAVARLGGLLRRLEGQVPVRRPSAFASDIRVPGNTWPSLNTECTCVSTARTWSPSRVTGKAIARPSCAWATVAHADTTAATNRENFFMTFL